MNRTIKGLFWGVMLLLMVSPVMASIVVSPDIVNFLPGQLPRQDVDIVNKGESNAYIAVTPYLVERPGTKQSKKVEIHDPAKLGLLVTPNKLIIPPQQHRAVRIMLLNSSVKEDVIYRITVVPVPNKLLPETAEKVKNRDFGIRVVVAYGVLAIARPEHMQPKLVVNRKGKELVIKNEGNTNIIVVGGEQCQGKKCFKLPPRRMYAGNVWKVKLDYAKPIKITTSYLGKESHIETS